MTVILKLGIYEETEVVQLQCYFPYDLPRPRCDLLLLQVASAHIQSVIHLLLECVGGVCVCDRVDAAGSMRLSLCHIFRNYSSTFVAVRRSVMCVFSEE